MDPGTRNQERVLICGTSTRAAAESAARVGFDVTALDAFADLDQHPAVRALSLPRDFGAATTPRAAAAAAATLDADVVVYLSSFESHPGAVRALAAGRTLWGNPPDVLRRVRNPILVSRTLRRRGFPAPAVRSNDSNNPNDPNDSPVWLLKPRASGGGKGVRRWRPGTTVPRACYLQEFIEGTPGSVVFVSSDGRAVPLGISRQLVGERAFGADEYRYCGNILLTAADPAGEDVVNAASELARVVTEEFGLLGVNGIDFIARDGVLYPIEVNPRWSASMEVIERAYGVSVFGAHASACATGTLPAFELEVALRGAQAAGKAVLFARRDVRAPDTRAWLDDPTVRDVPHPGESIPAGHPVCTVFAAERDADACYAALVARAQRVYEQLVASGDGRVQN